MTFILSALGWLKLVPRWAYAALGVVAVLLLLWHIHGGWEKDAYNAAYNAGWTVEHKAHEQTIANYKSAAAEAERMDKANIVRVTKEQTAITEKVTNDYQSKLADSTDRYERLRAKASGYLSHPASPGVPEDRNSTCEAVSGTTCEGIPTLLLEAQRNTDQLLALQAWVREQSAVDVGNQP